MLNSFNSLKPRSPKRKQTFKKFSNIQPFGNHNLTPCSSVVTLVTIWNTAITFKSYHQIPKSNETKLNGPLKTRRFPKDVILKEYIHSWFSNLIFKMSCQKIGNHWTKANAEQSTRTPGQWQPTPKSENKWAIGHGRPKTDSLPVGSFFLS